MRYATLGGLAVLALAVAGCVQPSQPPAEAAASPPSTQPPPPPPYQIGSFRDLVNVCRTAEVDPYYGSARGLCWGYVSGMLDFYLVDTATGRRARRVCLPPNAPSRAESVTGLLAWADANQQFMDESVPNGVMRYYISQYPCRPAMRGPQPARHRPPPPPPPR